MVNYIAWQKVNDVIREQVNTDTQTNRNIQKTRAEEQKTADQNMEMKRDSELKFEKNTALTNKSPLPAHQPNRKQETIAMQWQLPEKTGQAQSDTHQSATNPVLREPKSSSVSTEDASAIVESLMLSLTDDMSVTPQQISQLIPQSEQEATESVGADISAEQSESVAVQKLTAQAMQTLLLGNVAKYASGASIQQIQNNLVVLSSKLAAIQNEYGGLSDAYEAALADFESAISELSDAKGHMDAIQAKIDQAKGKLEELRQKLAESDPETEEYDALAAQIASLESTLIQMEDTLDTARSVYAGALTRSALASDKANDAYNNLVAAEEEYPITITTARSGLSTQAKYVELITALLKAIGDNVVDSIKSQQEMTKAINKTRLHELNEASAKIEKKQRTSSILRKIFGWLGAIVGIILAVVSLIAAIPSGGMTLGAGVALGAAVVSSLVSLADLILVATDSNWTISGKIFEGVNYIISKLMEYALLAIEIIATGDDKDLINESKDIRELLNTIFSTILTTVSLAAASILATGGFSAIGKTITDTTKIAADSTIQAIIKVVNSIAATLAKAKGVATGIGHLTRGLNAITSIILPILAGVYDQQSSDALAKLGLNQNEIKQLNRVGKSYSEQLSEVSKATQELNEAISEIISNRTSALSSGLKNTHGFGHV